MQSFSKSIEYPIFDHSGLSFNKVNIQFVKIKLFNQFSLDFVSVPSGSFLMGSNNSDTGPDAIPQHKVSVEGFFLGQSVVTQGLYKAVMGTNPSFFDESDLPVECINWFDADRFCKTLSEKSDYNFRLPSESEWEYAARAGSDSTFYCGEVLTDKVANYMAEVPWKNGPKGSYLRRTTVPGIFPPNPWGFYDMSGNTFDWCHDIYTSYDKTPNDGKSNELESGPIERVLRGGSWYHTPIACAVTTRLKIDPLYKGPDIGMRLVLE